MTVDQVLRFAWGRPEYPILSQASYEPRGAVSGASLSRHDLLAEAAMIQGMLSRTLKPIHVAYIGAAYGHGRDKLRGVMALSLHVWPGYADTMRICCDLLIIREFMAGRRDRPSVRGIAEKYGVTRWRLTGLDKEVVKTMKILGDTAINEASDALAGLLDDKAVGA